MDEQRIRKEAKALDDAIEKGIIEDILPFFTSDCEIELLDIKLKGKQGLQRALRWMKSHLSDVKLTPIVIMIENEVFFEEFLVSAVTESGNEVQMKQAEVLEYDNDYKVKSLRLYFDRLILAKASATNLLERWLANQISKSSTKGLV